MIGRPADKLTVNTSIISNVTYSLASGLSIPSSERFLVYLNITKFILLLFETKLLQKCLKSVTLLFATKFAPLFSNILSKMIPSGSPKFSKFYTGLYLPKFIEF